MPAPVRTFSGPALVSAADNARLTLSEERLAVVGPALTQIYGLIDALDSVDLGETPPATAFDARWE